MTILLTVWTLVIAISRCVVTVRSSMYFGMRPKLEDSARKLNKSMSSIRIFDFFYQFIRHNLGILTKKSTSASSQYWYNCDVRCYSYRIKNDCVVFVRRRLLLFSLFWPLRGRSKNWRESSDPDPSFTRVVYVSVWFDFPIFNFKMWESNPISSC